MRQAQTHVRRERAEALAIDVLSFIAGDSDRLGAFLAQTGLDPAQLRQAAASPGFLAGVLDFLAGEEKLLLEFAAHAEVPPDVIVQARLELGGPVPDGSV